MPEDEEIESSSAAMPFQLQLDKPIPFRVKMAEWNPEKDLLAMITDDSKVILHRFNWQRLWTISPGKCITSLCWSPDGKSIALGCEDGCILLHDVENGKLLKSLKSHDAAVSCLTWAESVQQMGGDKDDILYYEDRTPRFFPPPPTIPRMPGLGSGDSGLLDEMEDASQEHSSTACQKYNILCSGDKSGDICFSIYGTFPIGKISIQNLSVPVQVSENEGTHQLSNASISNVSLSKDLRHLLVLCYGELACVSASENASYGLHCLQMDTSIFLNRKSELHQMSQQASSIEELLEVVRTSISVISKQWSGAMNLFHEKFSSLASLIDANGLECSPQDEFLSLLFGARTSPALHQFLVSSLGEAGMKRVAKAVESAGKELRVVFSEHLQPAVEIIGFRTGELRGLSRWRARFQNIGLQEKLIDDVTEKAGMLLVHVERFSRVLATVLFLFQNFFNWILRCIKVLLSEPTDQVQTINSELVVIFVKFLLDSDPVNQLLEPNEKFEMGIEAMQRVDELVVFGGFTDTEFLEKSLTKQFMELEESVAHAFLKPFTTISAQIHHRELLPVYPILDSIVPSPAPALTSISFFEGQNGCDSLQSNGLIDYMCFKAPSKSSDMRNCIGIVRGITRKSAPTEKETSVYSATALSIPDEYDCVDLSLYKDCQLILLLTKSPSASENPGRSYMVMLQTTDLPFMSFTKVSPGGPYMLDEMKNLIVPLNLEIEKVRDIQHEVAAPLAVSATRGVACVFTSRRHALVYILDEDEDEEAE